MILAPSNRYPIVTVLLLLCAVSRFRHMFHLGCAGMSASIFHGLKTTGFGIPTYFEAFRSFVGHNTPCFVIVYVDVAKSESDRYTAPSLERHRGCAVMQTPPMPQSAGIQFPGRPCEGHSTTSHRCPSFPLMASGSILQDQTRGLDMKTQQGIPCLAKRGQSVWFHELTPCRN